MIFRLVMWWLHRQYIKGGMPIYYVKGNGKNYPRYMLYTEDEKIYNRMDTF